MPNRVSCAALAVTAVLASLLATAGCAMRLHRTLTPPDKVAALDKHSPYLKAHLRDGRVYVLSKWTVDDTARVVSGEGELLGLDRKPLEKGSFQVPIDSVALFETNVVQDSSNVAGLAVITGVSLAVTAYCIVNPKSCFGSCPTFYVPDGRGSTLQAEGFSDSVAPSLEARDVDALYRARPAGRDFAVRMKNEALETHVVRYVQLLAARRPEGGRVFATESGEFWPATEVREPVSCTAAEGSCLEAVRRFDGAERWSAADPQDLATRETIDVEFAARDADGDYGLVVASRQTLLSTFLFYQGLAYLGSQAGDWLARLERGDRVAVDELSGLRRALGGVEVLVEDAERRFRGVEELHEAGPLATDVKLVRLPGGGNGRVKVRLRMTRGLWRIDYLALAKLGGRVEPQRIDPATVRSEHPSTSKRPARPIVTLPGDEYVFTYRLPPEPDRYELFLESRGYYLEWMRQEWIAEENPARAALLFTQPDLALRLLASEFKQQEAAMEDLFWRSRYVPH